MYTVSLIHNCLNGAFEFALKLRRFDEALGALVQLHCEGSGASPAWHRSFSMLVSEACNNGGIAWLVHSASSAKFPAGFDASKHIVDALQFLAKSTDIARPLGVNYYDCLHAYLLSKSRLHDCARMLWTYAERTRADAVSAGKDPSSR